MYFPFLLNGLVFSIKAGGAEMSSKPDFPFYAGQPVELAAPAWLAIVVSVVAAFFLLTLLPFPDFPLNLLPAIVFTGLPLLTLAMVTGGRHAALFGHVGIKEVALAIGFGLLTLVASMLVGLVLLQVTTMTANATTDVVAGLGGGVDLVGFLVRTAIQLVGEELMTILPLLAVLWLCVSKLGMSRRLGLVIAVLVSTAWFAAVHLPTYNWNLVQCFGGIGAARLVLTAAFLVTRNLWVSAGAHIVNDWTEFFLPLLLAGGHTPIDPAA
jgi:membrane protease YdiL (CAAX protease family)